MEPTTLNQIRIDLRGNPQLKEYFTRKPDGHSCTVEITFDKSTITSDGILLGVMTSIAPEGYEEPATSEGTKPKTEVEPDAEEPVMVMIEGGPKKKEEEPATEPAAYV